MRRLLRWTRRLAGAALLGLASYWATRALLERAWPRRDPGAPYGLRTLPLDRRETMAAVAREWSGAGREILTDWGLQRSADPPTVAPTGAAGADPA